METAALACASDNVPPWATLTFVSLGLISNTVCTTVAECSSFSFVFGLFVKRPFAYFAPNTYSVVPKGSFFK